MTPASPGVSHRRLPLICSLACAVLVAASSSGWAQSGGAPSPAPAIGPLTESQLEVIGGADPSPSEAAPDATLLEQQIHQNEELMVNSRPSLTWSGYIDMGGYIPQGSGAGYVQDVGHMVLSAAPYRAYNWVFLGDILAPAVNARGEVADLGVAPGVNRFDSINSRGAPGFIINEVNLRLGARPAQNAIITASVNLTPRSGSEFGLGDVFDVDLAQLEWLPTASQRTSIFVGKMESVLGIEYRDRKANRRFGVTPSLISRYTVGTAIGVKVRSKFGRDDWLVIAAALTNGSNTTEQFHFYDEVDSNAGKTGSGRLSARLPLPISVEIGLSGSYGAQDRTTSNQHAMWFFGPDLLATIGIVDIKASWLKGRSAGDPAQGAYRLDLRGGGYLELDAMLTATWGLLARLEYRDAEVALAPDRIYVTKSWRGTAGARCVFTRWALLKAEYLRNGEFGTIPDIRNDVFTSSLVLSY